MVDHPDTIAYFGVTDFRGKKTNFGIKNSDRARHMYVIGKTGMGKSTLLENVAAQDIENGHGMCFVDPHGAAIEIMLESVPAHRVKDVVYFAPFDTDYPIAFNVMEDVGMDKRHLVASGLMSTFKKIWVDAWSARMEYILNNTILALLEYPDSTLLSVNRMLSDKGFRQDVVANITDPSVKAFWVDEYGKWDDRYAREAGAAIQNKIGQFTANPLIRNIIGQPKSSFDVREMMDDGKIFLVNLSKGLIGEQNAGLLGGMIITAIYLGAMSRADEPVSVLKTLPTFYLFVDEFQNFANDSFADILAEARKYKLALTVAHQYVAQMEESVADAIFGNVGTTVSFRVGPMDAETLAKVYAPEFTAEDIVGLGRFQMYLSLMIDAVGSRPFSATGIAPLDPQSISNRDAVIEWSRKQYASPRAEVQKTIDDWHEIEFKVTKGGKKGGKGKGGYDKKDDRILDLKPKSVHAKNAAEEKAKAVKAEAEKSNDTKDETRAMHKPFKFSGSLGDFMGALDGESKNPDSVVEKSPENAPETKPRTAPVAKEIVKPKPLAPPQKAPTLKPKPEPVVSREKPVTQKPTLAPAPNPTKPPIGKITIPEKKEIKKEESFSDLVSKKEKPAPAQTPKPKTDSGFKPKFSDKNTDKGNEFVAKKKQDPLKYKKKNPSKENKEALSSLLAGVLNKNGKDKTSPKPAPKPKPKKRENIQNDKNKNVLNKDKISQEKKEVNDFVPKRNENGSISFMGKTFVSNDSEKVETPKDNLNDEPRDGGLNQEAKTEEKTFSVPKKEEPQTPGSAENFEEKANKDPEKEQNSQDQDNSTATHARVDSGYNGYVSDSSKKPKEVPEDVLKRILGE